MYQERSLLVIPAERMGTERQFRKRMIVAFQTYGCGMAYVAYDLYAVMGLADAETFASQNFPVAQGVKFGEACAKFELVAVDTDGSVSPLFSLHGILRQAVGVDAEKVTNARFLEFQIAGNAVEAHHMNDIPFDRTEYPLEHIVEMYSDIGGDAATFANVALP